MTSRDVKSATRVLKIFELFAQEQRPLRQIEIIEELDVPQSSATMLLKKLTELGYLQFNPGQRRYFPTARVSHLGNWLGAIVDEDLQKLLKELQLETTETVFVAVQNGFNIQYVKILDSSHEIKLTVLEGSMRPMAEASAGWLLLSRQSSDIVEKVIRRYNLNRSVSSRLNIKEFMAQIDALRDKDYCYTPNLPVLGGGSIVTSLNQPFNENGMVVGVGGLTLRLERDFDKILKLLRKLVEQYSQMQS